jgi:hypothetical protein
MKEETNGYLYNVKYPHRRREKNGKDEARED